MGWLIAVGVIALPVMEIMVWIKSADLIGGWGTILLTILAVLAGTRLLRQQGLAILLNARSRMEQGEQPLQAAFDGLCLAAAGFLLVLPGFISDAVALMLMVPPVRSGLRHWVGARMVVVQTQSHTPNSGPVIIDGDYMVIEPTDHIEHPKSSGKRLEP